jgi:GT2 family glycosyltransferase
MKTNNKTALKISVVVCTYNRGKKIKSCLDSILNQSLSKEEYEIVVVNDGSTDDTAKILKSVKGIRIVTNDPNQGLAQSRNNGAKASLADIIVFTDDDCVADKDWLKNILKAYEDSDVVGVGGKIVPFRTDKWLLRYYSANNPLAHLTFAFDDSSGVVYSIAQYVKRSFSLKQLPDSTVRLYMIVGANMSMRHSVFEKVGGFDPRIRFGGEEEDFWTRLRKLGPQAKLVYAPDAIINHDYDSSFKDASRRNYKYGIGAARLYLKDRNRLPVIYPFPFIVLLSLPLLFLSPYFLLFTITLTLGLYSGWVKAAMLNKTPSYVCFSFTQLGLELINSGGFIVGFCRGILGRQI